MVYTEECRGYNIGTRLIEDFLARTQWTNKCADFRETAEVIAKVYYLPITR